MPRREACYAKHFNAARRQDPVARAKLLSDCEFLGILTPGKLGSLTSGVAFRGQMDNTGLLELNFSVRAANANDDKKRLAEIKRALNQTERDFEIDADGDVTFIPLVEIEDVELKINSLVTARNAARAAKNWAESDRIRDELAAMGVALKDNKDGTTTWEVKR